MMQVLSLFKFFMAFLSLAVIFLCAMTRALCKIDAAFVRIMSLISSGRPEIDASISATIFVYGILIGRIALWTFF